MFWLLLIAVVILVLKFLEKKNSPISYDDIEKHSESWWDCHYDCEDR